MTTELTVTLPKPHAAQLECMRDTARFRVLECGRRFGKSTTGELAISSMAIEGHAAAWFAPSYKYLLDAWRNLTRYLGPILQTTSKTEQRIELITGGVIDFWTLENEDAGRGRKYKLVIIDEAGLVRDLQYVWQQAIRPTLTDMRGGAWFLGTPKGRRYFHTLFTKGQDGTPGWKSWRLPTTANPYMDADEVEEARRELPRSAFEQEYLGIPADDGGNPFDQSAIERCRTIEPSTNSAVVFGVDLAKAQDWTWVIGLDEDGEVAISERWQSDWKQTTRRVADIIGNTPAAIDSTGVGDPIVEQLQRDCQRVESFKFTSNSKQQLMEGLAAAIQQERVLFADERLIAELMSFEYEYTKAGVKYTAPSGLHDDGVCALALAWHKHRDRHRGDIPLALSTWSSGAEDDDDDNW